MTGRRLAWVRERVPPPVKERLRPWLNRSPSWLQDGLRRLSGSGAAPRRVRWGNLRRAAPFDRDWGFSRGTPVDRVYIERFLTAHAGDVRGECLEVLNDAYTRRFGGDRVTRRDVLDLTARNLSATVIADLGEPDSLPPSRYDCVVFTQTLHLIPDMAIALANIWRAVRPGGALLVTVPCIGRHETRWDNEHDRWRLTPSGLGWLTRQLPGAEVEVTAYGNVVSAIAALHGIAAEEVAPAELERVDRDYPVIVAARIVKYGGS